MTGAKYVMHESAPAPNVDCHVRHNDALTLDGHQVKVRENEWFQTPNTFLGHLNVHDWEEDDDSDP